MYASIRTRKLSPDGDVVTRGTTQRVECRSFQIIARDDGLCLMGESNHYYGTGQRGGTEQAFLDEFVINLSIADVKRLLSAALQASRIPGVDNLRQAQRYLDGGLAELLAS